MHTNSHKTIAFFIPSMTGAGAERVALNLIQEFDAQGWNIHLLLNSAVGSFLPLVPKNVEILELRSSNFFDKVMKIKKYLSRRNPDYVVSLLDRVNAFGFAKLASGWKGKLAVSVHSTASQEMIDERSLLSLIKPFFMKVAYRFSDSVIAVSQGVAQDLSKVLSMDQEKIRIIYNPIVTEDLKVQAKLSSGHPWLNQTEVPVFLSIGRLVSAKDFSTLLRAFRLVRDAIPAKLIILGDGEERSHLQELAISLDIKDDIDLHGFVDNPYQYISSSSVFVLSSKFEGFGNVLVEALALGKKVVSTNCPSGPSEILDGGKYGKLVPVGDYHLLSDAMLHTLNINLDSQALANRASFFEVKKIAEEYMSLLTSL
jgi:glycosyltransferase involved in cell wall biosynthesis